MSAGGYRSAGIRQLVVLVQTSGGWVAPSVSYRSLRTYHSSSARMPTEAQFRTMTSSSPRKTWPSAGASGAGAG